MKKKLEGIISRVVSEGSSSGATPAVRRVDQDVNVNELIRRDDPGVMELAEDILRERGWKLRELGGGLHARNFTFELRPMWGPGEEWKMVQTNVDTVTRRPHKRGFGAGSTKLGPGWVWIKMTTANGPIRVQRERYLQSNLEEAKKLAVANAWAVAKAIKSLPLDTNKATIERIVDQHFNRRSYSASGLADIL